MTPEQWDELSLLDPLDGPGPARPMSDRQALKLVRAAVAAVQPRPQQSPLAKVALAAGICLALVGSAAAAGWHLMHRRTSERAARAVTPEVEPAAAPVVAPTERPAPQVAP